MAGGMPKPKLVSAADFPKVTPAEQRERDMRRMKLLKEEQAANLQAGAPDAATDKEIAFERAKMNRVSQTRGK